MDLLMQRHFPARASAVCALSLLCMCIGCSENSTTDALSGDVPPVDNATSQSNDTDVSNDELLKVAEEKIDAKQYVKAIELFTTLAERSPTATNHAFIGDCYWMQRKLEQADVHYRQALEVDPNHCGANHALGRDAVLLKRYQDAIPYLNTANEVCAGTVIYAQNLRFRVEALLELDRIMEAEADLEKLVTEYPEDPNTHEAGVLVARKRGDEALAAEYEAKFNAYSNGESQ